MDAKAPHISIKGETLLDLYGFHVTNSLLTSLVVTVLFLFIALYYSSESTKKNKSTFFYVMQGMLEQLHDLYESVLGNKIKSFFTLLAAFFFFILLNNWFGLLPGVGSYLVKPVSIPPVAEKHVESPVMEAGAHSEDVPAAEEKGAGTNEKAHEPERAPLFRAATADLNTTIALALITVILTQIFGFKFIGAGAHLKKYASPIGFLEGFSEISRILSFSFRLFGNIFAGEVMIVIISFLLPVLTPPFFLLEVFVGFIQAVVFSMLSAVFINLAIQKHH
jgi:F-type H+-transporting ATPase subunit a